MIRQIFLISSKTFQLFRGNTIQSKSIANILIHRFSTIHRFSITHRFSIIHRFNTIHRYSTIHNHEDAPSAPSTDIDKDRQLKLIELELCHFRDCGHKVPNPEFVKKQQWEELLTLKSISSRRKYYRFLFLVQQKEENFRIKKEAKRRALTEFKERQAQLKEEGKEEGQRLHFSNTSFLLRIRPDRMNMFRNNRLARAIQFGEKLIFDCSYDQHMNTQESSNAAKQLTYCFAVNRRHMQPFNLYFCNADFSGKMMKYLERFIPTMRNKEFPLNVHTGSYLDLFPKEKLVYLTPHCKDDLVEYNPDSVYIIGAMVDKMNQEPLSLGKAKELGLRMARLPLDRYLRWAGGSGKSLTLDQMTQIMLDIKTTRNWEHALSNVPRRKIQYEPEQKEKTVRKWKSTVDNLKFDSDLQKDDNTVSTADKFKKRIEKQKRL